MNSPDTKIVVTEVDGMTFYRFATVLNPPSLDAAWKKYQRSRDRITLLNWFGVMVAVGGIVLFCLSQVNW